MRYLHTMVRVQDLNRSLEFYSHCLGLVETHRIDNEIGRFTLVFLAAPDDIAAHESEDRATKRASWPELELTYNWDGQIYDGGHNFGHLAYEVDDIYALCQRLMNAGITINRPPRDGHMAFVKSPDGISIEILQKGTPLPPCAPWATMENSGHW